MSSGQAAYKEAANTVLTYTAEGNRYSAPNGLGLTNTSGFTNTTLTFGSRVNGILTPPTTIRDVAVNTSKYTGTLLGLDIQGQIRSSIYDVGCDETNGSGLIKITPLDTTKVGASSSTIIYARSTSNVVIIEPVFQYDMVKRAIRIDSKLAGEMMITNVLGNIRFIVKYNAGGQWVNLNSLKTGVYYARTYDKTICFLVQ